MSLINKDPDPALVYIICLIFCMTFWIAVICILSSFLSGCSEIVDCTKERELPQCTEILA